MISFERLTSIWLLIEEGLKRTEAHHLMRPIKFDR
jgi:hypothetical protein